MTVGFLVGPYEDLESGEWFQVPTKGERLAKLAEVKLKGEKVLVEASTSGKAVARFLKEMGVDVDLVGSDILLSSLRRQKTDKLDARDLARIARLGGYKTSYVASPQEEALRSLVRHAHALTQQMTDTQNQVKAIPQRNLIEEPQGSLRHHHVRRRWRQLQLPPAEARVLEEKLQLIEHFQERVDATKLQLHQALSEDEDLHLLLTIPGFDVYTCAAILGECGDMNRFPTAKKVAAYAGIVPRLSQSGGITRNGKITKSGPSLLRHALIQAAHRIVKQPGRLRNKYARLHARIGKKRALVAIARTLITIVWSMLVNRNPYQGQDPDAAAAKKWRNQHITRFLEAGEPEKALRLLRTMDVKRAHKSWLNGKSRLVPG
jgi:transposase